jgi:hypothetical protein
LQGLPKFTKIGIFGLKTHIASGSTGRWFRSSINPIRFRRHFFVRFWQIENWQIENWRIENWELKIGELKIGELKIGD